MNKKFVGSALCLQSLVFSFFCGLKGKLAGKAEDDYYGLQLRFSCSGRSFFRRLRTQWNLKLVECLTSINHLGKLPKSRQPLTLWDKRKEVNFRQKMGTNQNGSKIFENFCNAHPLDIMFSYFLKTRLSGKFESYFMN